MGGKAFKHLLTTESLGLHNKNHLREGERKKEGAFLVNYKIKYPEWPHPSARIVA